MSGFHAPFYERLYAKFVMEEMNASADREEIFRGADLITNLQTHINDHEQ